MTKLFTLTRRASFLPRRPMPGFRHPSASRPLRGIGSRPGPDYIWVEGYQYPQSGHYVWHNGYWTRPPYEGAYWVEPYHTGGQYYAGRWEGNRGNINHNHRWDSGKQRDERRDDRRR
jgi:hypothetical protein